MNAAHLHLILAHVPVFAVIGGTVVLAVGLLLRRRLLWTIASVFFLVAAVAAVPVYLSGEPAEEILERWLPNEAAIERHEDTALLTLSTVIATGVAAAALLVAGRRAPMTRIARASLGVTALLALGASGLAIRTAGLGGEIRHPEIRTALAPRASQERVPLPPRDEHGFGDEDGDDD